MPDRSTVTSAWRAAFVLGTAGLGGVALAEPAPGRELPVPHPVSIELAFEMAQEASESLAASSATVDAAQARVLGAESAYLPQLAVDATYQRTIHSEYEDLFDATGGAGPLGELPFAQKNVWRVGLNGSMTVFSGGRIEAGVRAAEAGVEGARVQLDSVRAQVVLAAAEAYYDAALAGRLVEIADASLAQAEEALRHATLAFSQGTRTEFDVLRAEVARDNERTNLTSARSQRRVQDGRLRRLLGVRKDAPIRLTSPLEADDLEAIDAAARRGAGIAPWKRRAPIREADAFVSARVADLGLARAERFPTLALTSQLEWVDYPSEFWFDRDEDAWRTNFSVFVVASFPLFTGFRRTADIRAARALVSASRARLAETVELADLEDLEASAQVDVAQAVYTQTGRTVEQAARAYEQARLRYEAGVSTYLDLVDARVVLQQARVNRARAGRELRVALVRRALLPGLPLTLPTRFVVSTASGTSPAPVFRSPALPLTPTTPGSTTRAGSPATATPTGSSSP